MDSYLRYSHPIVPILHVPSLNRDYKALRSGTIHSDSVYAIFNLIFALGALLSISSGAGQELQKTNLQAEDYFDRSQQLLREIDIMGGGSIRLIQALLLTAQYGQSTTTARRCWSSVGIAIRMAVGLGLHLPPPPTLDPINAEMRKRLWWCARWLDT
jgi:hypothetical protein